MKVSTYRAEAFMQAAKRLDIEVVPGLDLPPQLAGQWPAALAMQFDRPEAAVQTILDFSRDKPIQAIISVDDSATLIAAAASEKLGLAHNPPEAAVAARNKFVMRQLLAQAGVPVPKFKLFEATADPAEVAGQVAFPCVVKPLLLSGSRGVIRADNPAQFAAAFQRLARLLATFQEAPGSRQILVEDYIPGVEVAVEGILDQGQLQLLALFDKPDPLEGPFFEETIYVTPSRLLAEVQQAIAGCTAQAALALGLKQGPVHAELRINEVGPWLVEVAGRSIGGLCSNTLRFGPEVLLETLILRQAVGLELNWQPEAVARGVMMIPIPEAGLLSGVRGLAEAEAVPGIETIEITAKINYPLQPLPEGESYLGFIFSQAETPAAAEAALREAHRHLQFDIKPMLPLW
jgi:biotin carboxylase